jgi:hypothetical protein
MKTYSTGTGNPGKLPFVWNLTLSEESIHQIEDFVGERVCYVVLKAQLYRG